MFSRLATLLPVATLAAVAVAAPNAIEARTAPTCNSGSNYCCNQKFDTTQVFGGALGGVLNIGALLGIPIGLTCNPITVIGALNGGAQCTIQTACCQNVEQNGLIVVGCSPVNVL